ncbi:MAG: hypothetical protein JNL54_17885 [Kineosporiaceae bacterium]|nr:hypothetical protein [Kineosporiaceae bacterium]MBL8931994.1 hypothetical protein [Kineosporiaceae bacterium]
MAEKGHDYTYNVSLPTSIVTYDSFYGLPTPEYAEKWGLGVYTNQIQADIEFGTPLSGSSSQERNDSFYDALYGSWWRTEEGVIPVNGAAGCGGVGLRQANPIIYGLNGLQGGAAMLAEIPSQLERNSAVRSSAELWDECMTMRGHSIPDGFRGLPAYVAAQVKLQPTGYRYATSVSKPPIRIRVPAYDESQLRQAIQKEKALARVAVACDSESDLTMTIGSIRRTLVIEFIGSKGGSLKTYVGEELQLQLSHPKVASVSSQP